MYFIDQNSEENLDRISSLLLNERLFFSHSLRKEYKSLLKAHYSHLNTAQQQVILGWIDSGPPWRKSAQWDNDTLGNWQIHQLHPIKECLSSDWMKKYISLKRKERARWRKAAAQKPEAVRPLSVEEIEVRKLSELTEFLRTWNPTEEQLFYGRFDMSHNLQVAVSKNPQKFVSDIKSFASVPPEYVSALFQGLADAARVPTPFSWKGILPFALEVVEENITRPTEQQTWARQSILKLLEIGLGEGQASMALENEDSVRLILQKLATYPEDAIVTEEDNKELFISYEKSVRAETVNLLVEFCLWKARKGKIDSIKLGDLRWVREIFENMLSTPSPYILAAFGRWVPWLEMLDHDWTKDKLRIIFETGEGMNIAWKSYIVHNQVYDKMASFLSVQYLLACNNLSSQEKSGDPWNPQDSFAEHLMVFYIRGLLQLDGEDAILAGFFKNAPTLLRSHAIETLGRVINNDKSLSTVQLLRLTEMWQSRLDFYDTHPELDATEELDRFSFWFSGNQIEPKVAIELFTRTLVHISQLRSSHLIVETLSKFAPTFPNEVTLCLEQFVSKVKENWGIETSKNSLSELLASLDKTPGSKEELKRIRGILASRGFTQFLPKA